MLRDELVEATLVKGRGGVFDVHLDGKRIFSKHEEGDRFPEPHEILERIPAV